MMLAAAGAQTEPAAALGPKGSRSSSTWSALIARTSTREALAVTCLIALGPILVVLLLRLPLINQLNYADAWFYSSYAWAPKHDFAVFGWNYFAARSTLVLPIGLFSRALGAHAGYLLLRYLLALACGTSIFLCVRRFASAQVAGAAVALLYLQPFFSRSLLWDYTFTEVACGVIGISLWYWSEGRRLAWTLLPGCALAASAFANANVATGIFVFLVVEAVAALRGGRRERLYCSKRFGLLLAGLVTTFAIGYLGYVTILGVFDPYDLLRPTIEFLRENSKNSAPYVRPAHLWLVHEPRLWMPVVTSAALISVMRKRLLELTIPARIAQLCIGFTAFLWLYRFTVTSSVLEVWWSYNIVVIATAPAMGVLLHELTRSTCSSFRWICVAIGGFMVTSIVIRDDAGLVEGSYRAFSEHPGLLIGLLTGGLLVAGLMALHAPRLRVTLTGLLLAILAFMSFAPSVLDSRGTTGIFSTDASQEWQAYTAGEQFIKIIQNYDAPAHRVFLWWPGLLGSVSITWNDLPQSGNTLNLLGQSETISSLTPLGAARVNQQIVKYVMILAPRPSELDSATHALTAAGFPGALVRHGRLDGSDLHFDLIELANR